MTAPAPPGSALRSALRIAFFTLTGIAVPACVLTTAAYFTAEPAWLAQASPFRVLYAVLLTAHALLCLALGRTRWAAFFVIFVGFNVAALVRPVGGPTPPAAVEGENIQFLLSNVLTSNAEPERLLALITRESPDVIALLEIDQRWRDQLEPVLRARYPHRLFHPREDNFGLAVLSRLPISPLTLRHIGASELPSIEFTLLNSAAGTLRLLLTHPLPPGTSAATRQRDAQLAALATWLAEPSAPLGPPCMILGDLNATPWCPPLRRLLAQTGLRVAARDHGLIAPSWPAEVPFWGIPLDHVLLDSRLACTDYRGGPPIGSDHLPIIIKVSRIARKSSE